MIESFRKKKSAQLASNVLLAFVQSWNMHGQEEMSICSGALDLLRAYIGERPCCVWKNSDRGLSKVCERGMVDLYLNQNPDEHQAALKRTLVSGSSEYFPCEFDSLTSDLQMSFSGFLNVPIRIQETLLGILSIAVQKKESKDREFAQVLECLGRLIAIALQTGEDMSATSRREQKLRAEIESTSRELEHTNKKLIERVRELKTMSKELEKKVEQLTHLSRAKDEFLSVVSHELRTPLTSLKGFLCVLLDEEAGEISASQKKFLTIAKQSADRLNLIISDLLDISRIESGRMNLNMDVCSINEIVQTSVEGLLSTAENKKIKLHYDLCEAITDVWGDESRLQQVIDNILSNALKFTPHDGEIYVLSEEVPEGISVSVKDSGPGIAPEEKKKIFDMFYQADASTRRSKGGAGLGLAIANGIVSMHGGHLKVESEPGKGSKFTFLIPRTRAKKVA